MSHGQVGQLGDQLWTSRISEVYHVAVPAECARYRFHPIFPVIWVKLKQHPPHKDHDTKEVRNIQVILFEPLTHTHGLNLETVYTLSIIHSESFYAGHLCSVGDFPSNSFFLHRAKLSYYIAHNPHSKSLGTSQWTWHSLSLWSNTTKGPRHLLATDQIFVSALRRSTLKTTKRIPYGAPELIRINIAVHVMLI